jgi:ArsR family transcriptional regulator
MSESDNSTEKSPLDHLANLAWAAGDRLRLGVLRVLARDAFGVLELCQLFDIKQPSMSHHLKILSEAGLVVHRREGTNLYYRRAPAPSALVAELFCALDSTTTDTLTSQRLEAVQATRAEASRRFFAQFGNEYREHQDLIARLSDYGPRVVERTAAHASDAIVLEIGPGGGELLPEFASIAKEVIALDVSAEMLTQAKARARQQQVSNIRFVHGDTASALLLNLPPANAIVMNMVLHHIAKPADIFHHVAALLAPGGCFLLTELCEHSQGEKAREVCGDVWPGFHPDTLTAWAADAGLVPSHEEYQAQRNGFRLQLREFTQPVSATTVNPIALT